MKQLWTATIAFVFAALLTNIVTGCTAAQKQVAVGVLDVSGAVCEQLAQQTDEQWIDFLCAVTEAGSGVVSTFFARVKKEDAPTFAARHCPAEGQVAP